MADTVEDASSDVSDRDTKVCVGYCGDGECIVVFQDGAVLVLVAPLGLRMLAISMVEKAYHQRVVLS